MIVVADTTPLNYLVLIQHADLLPRLFNRVLIPQAVFEELQDPETPDMVRTWLADVPSWLHVQSVHSQPDPALDHLDAGEREAITLAEALEADQILLDEIDARREAARRKLPFIGTLGVLRRAAQLEPIDLPSTLARLQQTTFYVDPELIRSPLDEDAQRRSR
jgi:predicted nucleic acid-binding protein